MIEQIVQPYTLILDDFFPATNRKKIDKCKQSELSKRSQTYFGIAAKSCLRDRSTGIRTRLLQ